jgi:hypothetical protein
VRVYLAARYSRRAEMQQYAADLAQLGLGHVEAAWLTGDHEWDGSQSTLEELAVAQLLALDDVRDIARAQVVIVFTEEPGATGRNRGGRHVEYGMALAAEKHVVIVGPAENVFHSLPNVPRFATWQDAVAHLTLVAEKTRQAALRSRLLQ